MTSISAHANSFFIYGNDTLEVQDDTLILDSNNDSLTSDITIQFGETLNEQIYWDDSESTFVFTDDLDLQGNQLTNFRIEKQPNATIPNCAIATDSGRLYYNTTDNQAFVCDGSTWNRIDAVGGGSAVTKMVQTRNLDIITNINTAAYEEVLLTGTTDFIDNDTFTINGNGIEVETNGRYLATANIYMDSTGTRTNLRAQFFVNGIPQGAIGASAYIRRASGHDESSIALQQWLTLNANDVVTIRTQREAGNGNVRMVTPGSSIFSLMLPPQ